MRAADVNPMNHSQLYANPPGTFRYTPVAIFAWPAAAILQIESVAAPFTDPAHNHPKFLH
jgi:hypothetical protein